MIIVMQPGASEDDIHRVIKRLETNGYGHHLSRGVERTLIGAIGSQEQKEQVAEQLERLPMVERVVPILRAYKLVSREHQPTPLVVKIGDVPFGREHLGIIAGPCAVESEKQLLEAAAAVKSAGAHCLRGGAFKPRTSPYSFQGLGFEALSLLAAAREATGLPIVTEVMDPRQIEPMVESKLDALQVGTRNMHNFELLKEVGACGLPVVLKRGWAATVQEWLRAAEYVASAGNLNIIMCERGIRTFETDTRFTLDLSGMAAAKLETHLPIIVDPSHSTGTHKLVPQMSLAAIAAGADGLTIEVHPHPDRALSDGPQQLTPKRFAALMQDVRKIAAVVDKEL